MAGPVGLPGDQRNRLDEDALGLLGVAAQVLDHHLHRDMRLIDLPAVVIRHHGHRGIGQLRFARALGLP